MSTASERDKTDLEAICQAIAAGKKVDPDLAKRAQDKSHALRRKLDHELSVELIRAVRDE